MTRAIMIQGAGSNVGKSLVVAGLCRALRDRGLSVAPFKPQNMSNNAAVTADGGEIGRAQAFQAFAAGLDPIVDMNPVLLKPESETGAQVILQGRRVATLKARDYAGYKATLLPKVLESFQRLAARHDIVIVEGAGSPAEINLRAGDIANMGFAEAADIPVILVGDIDRGGVIAQLVGTAAVLPEADRDRIRGFVVNKFRGDPTLFDTGMTEIATRTGWTSIGLLPWFPDAWRLPAEDVMDIRPTSRDGALKVAVPRLNRIANFDDLDPLAADPAISVEIVEPGRPLPGDAALVLIPGSKATIADLADFRAQGWDVDLKAHVRRGGHVLGLCGGFQMLGRSIADPEGLEGAPAIVDGLGLLDVHTIMRPDKHVTLTRARHVATGLPVEGYEIHIGTTDGPDGARALLDIDGRPEGAVSADGRVAGCYLHGLFAADAFRAAYIEAVGGQAGLADFTGQVAETTAELGRHVETHLDLAALLDTTGR